LELLRDLATYNTLVVLAGSTLLGLAGGAVGVFMLLRRRALLSDAVSHATLPGVALGFLAALWLTGSGRSLPAIVAGAAVTGALGILAVQAIRDLTRLTEDTAIAVVLSVTFGLGVVLLSWIQTLPVAGQAGLGTFLLGQAAAMLRSDAIMIGTAALIVIGLLVAFLKELGVVAFDPEFAAGQGWPVMRLDLLATGLMLSVVAIGLQTVGLILIVALLIVPAVAARFWTERLGVMVLLAGLIGALSAGAGAVTSATLPRVPTGAAIVLCAGVLFVVSLLAAPARGLAAAGIRTLRLRVAAASRRGLMAGVDGGRAPEGAARALLRLQGLCRRDGTLTDAGGAAARDAVRQEQLWRAFLERYPEDAAVMSGWPLVRVDTVLPADTIAALEADIATGT
jgi:manganese/zinc/iron transport system permease protein